jgi:DNA-binding NtrC family response regulator
MDYVRKDEKFCIFVVDDEEIIASTVAALLRLKGFEAVFFTNPLDALEASHARIPDLLVSDIVMPLLSGLDLAIQMQALHPHCKALLFSGEWDAGDLSEIARKRSCKFEMISKPVHPKMLLRKVQEMLAIWPALPSNGEDRARQRLAENMKETVAAVQASIATSTARKRSAHSQPKNSHQE